MLSTFSPQVYRLASIALMPNDNDGTNRRADPARVLHTVSAVTHWGKSAFPHYASSPDNKAKKKEWPSIRSQRRISLQCSPARRHRSRSRQTVIGAVLGAPFCKDGTTGGHGHDIKTADGFKRSAPSRSTSPRV